MKEILIFCSVLSLIYAIKLKSFHYLLALRAFKTTHGTGAKLVNAYIFTAGD